MHKREDGFTLIELMMVVLIVAVLIAIAIPTYLGFRGRALDVSAQTSAVTALKAGKVIYSDSDSYANVNLAGLQATEPSVTYVDGSTVSNESDVASVNVPDPLTFVASVYSGSGTCFFIRDDMSGTSYATLSTGTADCFAAKPGVSFGAAWP